jgi:glycerol kinase
MHTDRDWGHAQTVLRVDGGMVASDWTMQFLADTLNAPVDRPRNLETTATGAAYLAGLQAGIYPPPEEVASLWKLDRRFTPSMKAAEREAKLAGWRDAVRRTLYHMINRAGGLWPPCDHPLLAD